MDAAVSALSALAVFASTVDHDAVRSVHGYRVAGGGGEGQREREEWVERAFVFSASSCREVASPVAAQRILPEDRRARPAFRAGQVVGAWRCILAFDPAAAVAPPSLPPPVLSPSGNPRLKSVPCLYNDLEKVFRFQNVEKVPALIHCDSEEQLIRSDAQEKTSNEVVDASGSDSDENPQSGEEHPASVQKQRRANPKHIASITLVDIAQHFHLPIREASKTLKIGVSILKRKCRQYGIPRWPHRKIKSLDSLIHDLEYVLDDRGKDDVQEEAHKQQEKEKHAAIKALTRRKRMLETEKETIQKRPEMDLMAETKQFREDVFKRRYRAKNAASD